VHVHWLLIIGTLFMRISGFMMSAIGGHGVSFFGLELAARNPNPADPREVVALEATQARVGHALHGGRKPPHRSGRPVGALGPHLIDRGETLRSKLGPEVGVAS
jgi:hypothetical protein